MNRQETDREAKATKNVKNVWKWIVGVGLVLSLVAWLGGFLNHDSNPGRADNPADHAAVADSVAADTVGTSLRSDTVYESVRGTK